MITSYGIGLLRIMKRAYVSTGNIGHLFFVKKVLELLFQTDIQVDKLFVYGGHFVGCDYNYVGFI